MSAKVNIHKLFGADIPTSLKQLQKPPKHLYVAGQELAEWQNKPKLAIVGSRKMTAYGSYVTDEFSGLAARVGIVIISGLAYGVDAAAHRAALAVDGQTVAILPTAVQNIYPSSHLNLANQIMEHGSLISEYAPEDPVFKTNFTDRNRLVAGLADALLITEAAVNSGSLHTARFALEQGKTVMAVPGNINSPTSEGCNNLIKSGALPVTNIEDVFLAMGLNIKSNQKRSFKGSKDEQAVYNLIAEGIMDQQELAFSIKLDAREVNSVLTGLEINGYIKALGAGRWVITS